MQRIPTIYVFNVALQLTPGATIIFSNFLLQMFFSWKLISSNGNWGFFLSSFPSLHGRRGIDLINFYVVNMFLTWRNFSLLFSYFLPQFPSFMLFFSVSMKHNKVFLLLMLAKKSTWGKKLVFLLRESLSNVIICC